MLRARHVPTGRRWRAAARLRRSPAASCPAATSTRSASPARRSTTRRRIGARRRRARLPGRGTSSWRSTCAPGRCAGGAASTCPASRPARCRSGARSRWPAAGSGCRSVAWRATAAATRGGWSASASTATVRRSLHGPDRREAGIWTPPGPGVDSAGHLSSRSATASPGPVTRTTTATPCSGSAPRPARDSFSPTTWPTDNDADLDLGSQGAALVGTDGCSRRQVRHRRTSCGRAVSAASAAR